MSIEPQRTEKRIVPGSFAERPHATWPAMRDRGEPVFQCSATSKRSGVRCRFAASKISATMKNSKGLCYWHGANGGSKDKRAIPTSRRHLSNITIKKARTYADAEMERRRLAGELHHETAALFRDTNRTRLHPADEGRLWLAADDYLKNAGLNPSGAWRESLRVLGLASPRSTATTKAISSTTGEPLTVELSALDWRKSSASSNDED